MFELLRSSNPGPGPGLGTALALPHHAGVLRAGMSERAAQWAVAALADVRETWVCGAGWAFSASYEGLELLAYGGTDDADAAHNRAGLDTLVLSRQPGTAHGPSAVPVALDDVDLFGHPAADVLGVVGERPYPDVILRTHTPASSCLGEILIRQVRQDIPVAEGGVLDT
ncbi:hypothetical protein HY68_05770 [Streptomyces sp. AcH 505]|uniref:hypothetical protein n=1 Tax=Streptomyces sp. AcH 505 TaxID=352211 RepID=UPI0005920EAA|nr:hypothetical protein HY68_05770 [Streptomyces sp. AcH 505]